MILFSLALAQVVSSYVPETIDLTIPRPCRAGGADEVVVCANRNGGNPYRLKQVPPPRKEGLPSAQAQIAEGVTVSGETEYADVGGFPSNRAMIRLKIRF